MERILLALDESALASDAMIARGRPRPPALHPPPLSAEARAIACRGWEDRAAAEYVGVQIVRRFHGLLVDLNAPLDLQDFALRMMVEESDHTRLCMAAARSLGSDGQVSFALPALQQARSDAPLEAQAIEMLAGTYGVGEVVAKALVAYSLRALPPSPYREVLQRIAKDEARHARLGALVLRHVRDTRPDWLAWPGEAALAEVVRAALLQLRGRDWVEEDELVIDVEGALARELATVGMAPAKGFVAAAERAMRRAVPRAFGDLLGAASWARIWPGAALD